MINPNDINRDNFIKKLSSMTPEDINTLIREKGKKPKLVRGLCRVIKNDNGGYDYAD